MVSKPTAFVQDTSELDYTRHTKTQNLGHIGDDKRKGLMVQALSGGSAKAGLGGDFGFSRAKGVATYGSQTGE